MKKDGVAKLINEICLTRGDVSEERIKAYEVKVRELRYLENVCMRHLAYGSTIEHVARALEVSPKYVRYQKRKAIRHMRTPDRYYSLLLGLKGRQKMLEEHKGTVRVDDCHFTTKTVNTLKRNGFLYIEELDDFIGNVPERFAYIDGLGKLGMSEILYYYARRNSDD